MYSNLRSKIEIPHGVEQVLDILVNNKAEVMESTATKGFLPMLDDQTLDGDSVYAYKSVYQNYLHAVRDKLDGEMLRALDPNIQASDIKEAAKIIDDLPVYRAE